MGDKAKAKPIVYNDNDRAIVKVLKENGPMTAAEIGAALGKTLNNGTIASVRGKGLIADAGEKEIKRPATKSVATYEFVDAEVKVRENGKAFNYTDTEKVILDKVANAEVKFYTLAELSDIVGVELKPGNVSGLVKKGNLVKGENAKVNCFVNDVVKVYEFVKDVPTNE